MTKILNDNNRHWNIQHLFILLILTFLCYWPLAFGVFSAKNDNIVQFLPVRFHVSEALRNGHLPLWSPYMYLGYPIHGDMQGGAWNPVVWLLSLFGRYNVTSLHCEILISIFIAGAGMYRLLGIKNLSPSLKLIGAGAYLMCGYITDVGGSNLPFLWAAAYAPFVLAYYYDLLNTPSLRNALKPAVALSLFFVSAYPSFFIITGYILLAGFLVVIIKRLYQRNNRLIKKIVVNNIFMALAFLGLSAVAIISYVHVLPFYQRGSGVSLKEVFVNSFHPSCSVSFILPSVPIKNPVSFTTDLISRNLYFNSFILVFIFCYAWMKKTIFLNFILAGILFFYLFSLGDFTPIRALCYKLFPLMDTFRHPANARLFLIIGCIISGMIILQNFMQKKLADKYPFLISLIALFGVTISALFSIPNMEINASVSELFSSGEGMRMALKNFFDKLSVPDLLVLNGITQIIFLIIFILLLRKKEFRVKWLVLLFVLNSFVFAQFTIPYTLTSKISPSNINTLVNSYPKNYPLPDKNKSIQFNSSDVLANYETIGISGFYNKKIAITDVAFTPTFMMPIQKVLSDSFLRSVMLSNPYAFFAETISSEKNTSPLRTIITGDPTLLNIKSPATGHFELVKFWNNGFDFKISTQDTAVFCLQQLNLPGWECKIDEKKVKLSLANDAFMAVKIPRGTHSVKFIYKPASVIKGLILSIISFIAIIFLFLTFTRKKNA